MLTLGDGRQGDVEALARELGEDEGGAVHVCRVVPGGERWR